MTEADLRELQETAQKLEAAARKLSTGSGRDQLLEDIARFRAQVSALQAAVLQGE
jgi:cell division protein FtsB